MTPPSAGPALAIFSLCLLGSIPPTVRTGTSAPSVEQAVAEDLLTFASGVLFVRQSGLARGSAAGALRTIDGDPRALAVSVSGGEPVELVFKLPARTTFDRFAVPNVVERPGNATFFRDIVVSGALEDDDGAYQPLAHGTLETHGPGTEHTELEMVAAKPVRYLKIRLSGGIQIEEGEEDRTLLEFSELVGNGTQERQSLSTAFTGRWDFRLTERTDLRGVPLALTQEGASVFGCLGHTPVIGSINGRIARLNGADVRNGRASALILVADDDGGIQGAWSQNRGVFRAQTAVEDAAVEAPPCAAEAPEEPRFCGVSVYVSFAFNSAEILAESEQVLADLYVGLMGAGAQRVLIEGHTSTEGSVEYNLDLSERRARAVVQDLVSRGFPEAALAAVGRGESAPLMRPDDDESSRAINRRVEVECTS